MELSRKNLVELGVVLPPPGQPLVAFGRSDEYIGYLDFDECDVLALVRVGELQNDRLLILSHEGPAPRPFWMVCNRLLDDPFRAVREATNPYGLAGILAEIVLMIPEKLVLWGNPDDEDVHNWIVREFNLTTL